MAGTAIALAASSAALAAAAEARRQACKATLQTYDSKTADVTAAREYASCVQTVYGSGEPMTGGEIIGFKIVIVFAIVGFLLGAWHGGREDGPIGGVLLGGMGLRLGAMAPVIVLGCAVAVQFLFS